MPTTLKTALQGIASETELDYGFREARAIDRAISTLEKMGINLDEIIIPEDAAKKDDEIFAKTMERRRV